MDIALRNIKHAAFASEETHCFSATVYIDGKKAGTVSNAGHGGPNDYEPHTLEATLDAHGLTLPVHHLLVGTVDHEITVDAEILIGDLVNDYLVSRELKRSMATRILFTRAGVLYESKRLSKSHVLIHLADPDKVKTALKADQILNLMPIDQALVIYRKQQD